MSKPLYILADLEEEYLVPIQLKLFQELGSTIDVEVITEREYFDDFFSVARRGDVLLISEELYHDGFQRHDIKNIFVMSESVAENKIISDHIRFIYKYTSVKKLYDEILYIADTDRSIQKNKKEPQVILVYSPIGGAGKTTISIGLAAALEENYKGALYIDAEYLQSFHCFTREKSCIPNEFNRHMYQGAAGMYNKMKACVRKEGFAYFPPLRGSLDSLRVDFSAFIKLIKEAKQSQDYDYIIVDTDSLYTKDKADLIEMADKVLIVTKNDSVSCFRVNLLIDNMNMKDKEKFIFICNFYDQTGDQVLQEEVPAKYMIGGYIRNCTENDLSSVESISKLEDIHRLVYLLD